MKYLAIIAALLCGLIVGCITPHAVLVNEELKASQDEQMLWRRVELEQHDIDNSGLLYQDPKLENYLNRIAKKLQANSISPDFHFKIKVLKDSNLNAFAYPNGVIYIHSGILARMDNEAQLAALLSHEITHCTHRHSLRVIRSLKDRPRYIAAVQEALSKSAVVQEVAQLLGAAGSIAAVTGYSRELETEADLIGLDLMAKANYDPKEALKLFENLKQEIESEGMAEPFFFGTHPNVQQRMENVQNWLAGDKQGYKTRVRNSAEFKNRMQGAILTNVRLDLRLGRFEVAQKTLEKYLAMQPNDAQAYYLFGESYRQRDLQNDARTAVSYYAKAISLDPLFPEPHKALGLIHYKEGDKHLAKKYFESCLLLSPNAFDKAYIRQYLKNCQHNGEKS